MLFYTVFPGNDVLIDRIEKSLAKAGVELITKIEGAAPNALAAMVAGLTGYSYFRIKR